MNESFLWPVRVYYEDTDAGGVVYYANYLKFFERARTEWLRALGFEQDALRHRFGLLFMVHSVSVEYRRPAFFNDLLEVASHLEERHRVSMVFSQTVRHPGRDGLILCTGKVKVACVDEKTMRPRPLPTELLPTQRVLESTRVA